VVTVEDILGRAKTAAPTASPGVAETTHR